MTTLQRILINLPGNIFRSDIPLTEIRVSYHKPFPHGRDAVWLDRNFLHSRSRTCTSEGTCAGVAKSHGPDLQSWKAKSRTHDRRFSGLELAYSVNVAYQRHKINTCRYEFMTLPLGL